MTTGYTIRPARPADLAALPAIERAAARGFPSDLLPAAMKRQTVPAEVLRAAQAGGRLWVVRSPAGTPVGFALASAEGDTAVLEEMDVHPDHQRRGLGRALVAAVAAWARAAGLRAVGLTTFAGVPWNAPFYARLGFAPLAEDEADESLRRRLAAEARRGLRGRIGMRLTL